jgi:hypothetical protein
LGPSESFSPAVFKQQACVVPDDQGCRIVRFESSCGTPLAGLNPSALAAAGLKVHCPTRISQ